MKVNWRQSVSLVGTVVKYLAAAMLIPLFVGIVYGDDVVVFVVSILLTVVIGVALEQVHSETKLHPREALPFAALSWLAVAIVSSIPYVLAGWGTTSTLAHPVNALFESMSGFTTTGATVMGEIGVNQHSHALLMWRQLTQWLGGMGIIVLMVAILPDLEAIGGSLATLGNIGPAFGRLGPFGSYLLLPDSTKLLMVFLMWAGRLEIIPVLVVLTGPFWKQ